VSSVITVEIGGQRYPIRSSLDERYVTQLAAYVDQKMRVASDSAPSSDMLGLAVLVALNIADEYFRERERDHPVTSEDEWQERAVRLEQILDDVLSQTRQAG